MLPVATRTVEDVFEGVGTSRGRMVDDETDVQSWSSYRILYIRSQNDRGIWT